MTSFTPGPWAAEPKGGRGSWVGNGANYAALSCGRDDAEADANALLIAAAPEMYAALKMAEVVWSTTLAHRLGGTPNEQREPVLNAIRAAISKANGESA